MMIDLARSTEIEKLYPQLSSDMDMVYAYISRYNDIMQRQRDYGSGTMVSMVEVHTLTMIADHPGITVNELTKMWNRTKGAVSQNIKKLEQKGLISRQRCEADGRVIHLYTTESGSALSALHKEYDYRENIRTISDLKDTCTDAEIKAFFKIMQQLTAMLKNTEE